MHLLYFDFFRCVVFCHSLLEIMWSFRCCAMNMECFQGSYLSNNQIRNWQTCSLKKKKERYLHGFTLEFCVSTFVDNYLCYQRSVDSVEVNLVAHRLHSHMHIIACCYARSRERVTSVYMDAFDILIFLHMHVKIDLT